MAPANRRKSIAWRLQEFFRCSPKSVQYVQLLTVRPHLYMNAAAPLYNKSDHALATTLGCCRPASLGEYHREVRNADISQIRRLGPNLANLRCSGAAPAPGWFLPVLLRKTRKNARKAVFLSELLFPAFPRKINSPPPGINQVSHAGRSA